MSSAPGDEPVLGPIAALFAGEQAGVDHQLHVVRDDWEFTDPAGQPLDTVRQLRDDIKARVETLTAELLASGK